MAGSGNIKSYGKQLRMDGCMYGRTDGWMDGWLGDLVVMFSRILNNPRPYCLLCASVSGF